jgi:hypothetical protein
MSIMPPKGLLDGYAVGQVRQGRVILVNEIWLDVVLEQGPGWGIYGVLLFADTPRPEVARRYQVDQPITVVITHLVPDDRHSLRLRLADESPVEIGTENAEQVAAADGGRESSS